MLANYGVAVKRVEMMLSQGHSVTEIDNAVKVDDEPALRALRMLREEVIQNDTLKLSKSRLAADLRATLGYGGMIHMYKNYVLRHDNDVDSIYNQTMVVNIDKHIESAMDVIQQYQQLGTTSAEAIALEDIKITLSQYQVQLKKIGLLVQNNASLKEIDNEVKVDDTLAIRGLRILDREIYRQLNIRSQQVDKTIQFVIIAIQIGKWVSVVTVLIVMIMILWLIRFTVIKPVTELIGSMVKLTDEQLDVEIPGYEQNNEIGQMVHSVSVFKKI
jgi:hypothetical protein